MTKDLNFLPLISSKAYWITFDDPEDEDKTWVFDATFLLSNWTCIFGKGCKGILPEDGTELGLGCCSHGAYIFDKNEGKKILNLSKKLPKKYWQFKEIGDAKGIFTKTKQGTRTRLHKGACLFLNRPGFSGGHGCALHIYAVKKNVSPINYKPYVCWQLPLRFEDLKDENGHTYTVLRQWQRYDWGEGGKEFHWWCTESKEAFVGKDPVYIALKDDLIHLCGKKIYFMLANELDKLGSVVKLPHPALKKKQ
jgi:hypothetical protein